MIGRRARVRPAIHSVVTMWNDLSKVRELIPRESGLAVAVVYRRDGSAATSVVNAGVIDHPVTGHPAVVFVTRGHRRKLRHLRRDPRAIVVIRTGWEWVAVEGTVELAGPEDHLHGLDPAALPMLLRSVYAAAVGGDPSDWAALDEAMASEGHTVVLVSPTLIYGSDADAP